MLPTSRSAGAGYAPKHAVLKNTDNPAKARRGFISNMLAPVNCRREPRFGVRQTMWTMTLTFGAIALMRLFLAN